MPTTVAIHPARDGAAVALALRAGQTLRADTSDSAARQAITGRLVALAQTHDVLTSESWQGAELGELVAQALRPHGERFRPSTQPRGKPAEPSLTAAGRIR
jgi:two-component sensor histidine kinase